MISLNEKAKTNSSFNPTDVNEFLVLVNQITDLASKSGIHITPYKSPSLPHFSKLPVENKKSIIEFLRNRVNYLEQTVLNGSSLNSNKQVIWHALKSFEFIPCSDFMSKIDNDHVIEIHTLHDLVQIFHSFTFYSKSSYTLEEIFSYPWQSLYNVDAMTSQNIFNLAQKIISGEIKTTFNPNFPEYIVEEKMSEAKLKIKISYHCVCPLFNKEGVPVAAASVETLEVLNKDQLKVSRPKLVADQDANL